MSYSKIKFCNPFNNWVIPLLFTYRLLLFPLGLEVLGLNFIMFFLVFVVFFKSPEEGSAGCFTLIMLLLPCGCLNSAMCWPALIVSFSDNTYLVLHF